MIWNMDWIWLVMALGAVATLGFFLGHALDAVLGRDGFGAFPTMFLFIGGFFAAVYLANRHGVVLRDLTLATSVGIFGSLALILVLVMIKAGLSRLPR
jgi:hypothetical protein